jgi:sulfite reductase (ferredoxin)
MTEKKEASVSSVEVFKHESDYLSGDIPSELIDGNDFFGKGSIQLLKHHGTYQQDHRDQRSRGEDGKSKKNYIFMVRLKIPGGMMTSDQLLAEMDLCDEVGNTTLRITSRQGLQLHGVLKTDLAGTIQRIQQAQLTTLGACGDVCRNVMCCPSPSGDPLHQQIQELAGELAEHFAPRSPAFHDIWLTDTETGVREQIPQVDTPRINGTPGDDVEPIYGKQYLPRKFKIGIALPDDNCVDVYTHDLGLIAVVRDGVIEGYNVLVGGGQGLTPSAKKTFAALGQKMAFVTPGEIRDVATAIVSVQRDHGNRVDRKVARLKYLVHNWGLEKFRNTVEQYYGKPLADPDPSDVVGFDDHMGWHPQVDGRWFYGLNVENGRIRDTDQFRLKSALREICQNLRPGIRLTAHQSILLSDIDEADRKTLEKILRDHGVPLSEEISNARRWSMACVAWPTCGLSITESERALPGMITQLETELERLGLEDERFTIRMTGCPNGCARPYNPDIGLVGRTRGKYTLYLGGRLLGNRLAFLHRDMVPAEEVVPTLVTIFEYFKQDRQEGETLGDFCHRKGNDDLLNYSPRDSS